MATLFDSDESGALFSDDRKHRYRLWRIWDTSKPKVMFVGLNPSTANETEPDPTINCVIKFSKAWGYGGFYMMNLFSLVSSKPKALLTCEDPVRENDIHLREVRALCKDVLFAWGGFKEATSRIVVVEQMFPDAMCIWRNDKGVPVHPLWAGVYAPAPIKELFTEPRLYNSLG